MLCAHMFINNSQSPIKSQPPMPTYETTSCHIFVNQPRTQPRQCSQIQHISSWSTWSNEQGKKRADFYCLTYHGTLFVSIHQPDSVSAAQVSYPTVCQVSDLKLPYWPISPWSQTATSTGQGILKQFGKSPCSSTSNSCSTLNHLKTSSMDTNPKPQTPNPRTHKSKPKWQNNSQKNHTNQKKKSSTHLGGKTQSHSSKKIHKSFLTSPHLKSGL